MSYFNALNIAIREHNANPLIDLFYQGIEDSCKCVQETLNRIEIDVNTERQGAIYIEK